MPALNPKNGYTLVELLVVIAIMGLLSISSVVYYKSLSSDKEILKAIDSVQSLLRTAQSNATSGFDCAGAKGATRWSVELNSNTIDLLCDEYVSSVLTTKKVKTLSLENNVKVDFTGCGSDISLQPPISISYSPLLGKVQFTGTDTCIANSTGLTFTLKKADTNCIINPENCKSFTVSKGGAINAK